MLSQEQFGKYLQSIGKLDHLQNKILPALKNAVINSALAAQSDVENRKCSFELFGYDFMIDSDFNVWLIEVNCSQSLEYSTVKKNYFFNINSVSI